MSKFEIRLFIQMNWNGWQKGSTGCTVESLLNTQTTALLGHYTRSIIGPAFLSSFARILFPIGLHALANFEAPGSLFDFSSDKETFKLYNIIHYWGIKPLK